MAAAVTAPTNVLADTPAFPPYCDAMFLATSVAETWTVPEGVYWVIICPTAATWIRFGATAVVPTTEIADGTAPFLIPASSAFQCRVAYGDTLSMIQASGSNAIVSIGCWKGR